jgi:hypothetical protein
MSAFGGKADMATYSTFSKSGKFYAHLIDCHSPIRLKIHHRLFACPLSVRRNMLRRRQPGRPIWGRKVMEWFSQKTSIAGTQIPNWVIVVGAIIIILLILGRI